VTTTHPPKPKTGRLANSTTNTFAPSVQNHSSLLTHRNYVQNNLNSTSLRPAEPFLSFFYNTHVVGYWGATESKNIGFMALPLDTMDNECSMEWMPSGSSVGWEKKTQLFIHFLSFLWEGA